ncbi:abortive infection system antitoxin AbiGi family protein [Lactobacillus delbrueckii subsp. sunkii]|nr:abortive infection system antitoxin AbiGi family protein [Lactobacillus delbrueckii subsp. sunkii]
MRIQKANFQNESDYVQSANTLFNFMPKPEYLYQTLRNQFLTPRYCKENIEYLNLTLNRRKVKHIYVLEKCFCDIPMHSLVTSFNLQVIKPKRMKKEIKQKIEAKNTHPKLYGEYAISFSKEWGKKHELEPIRYVQETESCVNATLSKGISALVKYDNLSDDVSEDYINRLCYLKPLHGKMEHNIPVEDDFQRITVWKNFNDEREWRYVPSASTAQKFSINRLYVNVPDQKIIDRLNDVISRPGYKNAGLPFDFSEIQYLIVPNNNARIALIKELEDIFANIESYTAIDRDLLISKIITLSEIEKDW